MGLTKRQEALVEVLNEKPGEYVSWSYIVTEVNKKMAHKENKYFVLFDSRNQCPGIGEDQRAINADMTNDYIIITHSHCFMIMPTKDKIEKEIAKYYSIALAKLQRAREFEKKAKRTGQYDLLKKEFRLSLLDVLYKELKREDAE